MGANAMPGAQALAMRHWIVDALLWVSEAVAALMLAADLLVICVSVILR